jgi:anti-sigma B factor antagonist
MLEMVEVIGDVTVVRATGEYLDAGTSKAFKASFAALASPGGRTVLELDRLQFVDSSGCGAILSCVRQARATGGDLKVSGVSKPVRALFELIRLHRVVDIYNTRDEALDSVEAVAAG